MSLLELLPWVLPPLLGAVIGFITNALAIKMLFRPLAEKRIFGIRIPLTPGIIPRRRYQLSESIARMVSTKLLTEEVLVEKIRSDEFQASLRNSVGNLTADLLTRGRHDLPASSAPDHPSSSDGFVLIVEDLLTAFFSSDAFRTTAVTISSRLTAGALSLTAGKVLPSEEQTRSIVSHLTRAMTSPRARTAAESAVRGWVDGHVRRNTRVKELLGRPLIAGVLVALPRLYEPITQTILEYLRLPDTRKELALHGRELLKRVLNRLNILQRFLVSATQYQKNLNDNMPGIVDDLITSLEQAVSSPKNRVQLLRAARRKILEWSTTGLGDLIELIGIKPEESIPRLVDAAATMLSRGEVRSRLEELVLKATDSWQERTVAELVTRATGMSRDELVSLAEQMVRRWTSDAGRMESFSAGLRSLVQRLSSDGAMGSVGDLIPLSEAQKESLDGWLTGMTAVQIERRVPELLRGVDIHTMVVNKIDALDVKSVEDLLLMVIARHLKWINLFGGVLGAMIGGLQVLLNVLT